MDASAASSDSVPAEGEGQVTASDVMTETDGIETEVGCAEC